MTDLTKIPGYSSYLVKEETALITIKEDPEIKQLLIDLAGRVNLVFNRVRGLESIQTGTHEWVLFTFLASDGRYIVSANDRTNSYLYSCAEKSEELELRDQLNTLLKQIKRKIDAKQSWVWDLGNKSEPIHIRSAYFSAITLKVILNKIKSGNASDLTKGSLGLLTEYPRLEPQIKTSYQGIKDKLNTINIEDINFREKIIANYRDWVVPRLVEMIKKLQSEQVISEEKEDTEDIENKIFNHLEVVRTSWDSYLRGSREDVILFLAWNENPERVKNAHQVMDWIKETLKNKDYKGLENKWANLKDDYDGSLFTFQEFLKTLNDNHGNR